MKELKSALEKFQLKQKIMILLQMPSTDPVNLGTYHPLVRGNRVYFSTMPVSRQLPASIVFKSGQKIHAAVLIIKTPGGKTLSSSNIKLILK
jgi:hypothetical protein